jgi:16S rRNA processing protein RimM
MQKSDSFQIGTIIKTHGIHGELIIEVSYPELIDNYKEPVFLQLEGLLVPFFIKTLVPVSNERFRIAFDWIETEIKAKKLVQAPVLIPNQNLQLSEPYLQESPELLVGFRLIDVNTGTVGEVLAFLDNKMNPLLAVETLHGEQLIPFHPHFIRSINPSSKEILVELPEGLIDLN